MTDVNLEIKSISENIFVLNRSKQYKCIREKTVKKKSRVTNIYSFQLLSILYDQLESLF